MESFDIPLYRVGILDGAPLANQVQPFRVSGAFNR